MAERSASTAFARRYLVVAGVVELVLGLLASYILATLSTLPQCTPSSNCGDGPKLFSASLVGLGLATVIGTALMRHAHRAAWTMALVGQLGTLVAIIVPVVREPYEIGWGLAAVFPIIGVGLLLNRGLRVAG